MAFPEFLVVCPRNGAAASKFRRHLGETALLTGRIVRRLTTSLSYYHKQQPQRQGTQSDFLLASLTNTDRLSDVRTHH